MARLTEDEECELRTPPSLLAIIQAARRIGDTTLEKLARQDLLNSYGIEVTFRQEQPVGEAHHAR
jgi:hypothetical protein